jgi:hypothetical protein
MSALPVERILVAHADPITDRPVQQLAEAWRFAVPSHLGNSAPLSRGLQRAAAPPPPMSSDEKSPDR